MDPNLFRPARPPAAPPLQKSYWKNRLQPLAGNKAAVVAAIGLAILIFFALVGPAMNPHGYNDQHIDWINLPPRIPPLAKLGIFDGTGILPNRQAAGLQDEGKYPPGSVLEIVRTDVSRGVEMCDIRVDFYKLAGVPEDTDFWFGTDYLGRDLWTRLWRGTQMSLLIALVAVLVSLVAGVFYGAIAGFYGGKTDMLLMRFAEVVGAFPQVIVATMLVLLLGTGIKAMVAALALRGWVGTARLVRGQFLRYREREYVLAARSMGAGSCRLIFRHILPNAAGPVITRTMTEIPSAILSESFLAYIGLGLQAPEPSLGVLLSDAKKVLTVYPTQTLFPALVISGLMMALHLLGNGVREAFDPRES